MEIPYFTGDLEPDAFADQMIVENFYLQDDTTSGPSCLGGNEIVWICSSLED